MTAISDGLTVREMMVVEALSSRPNLTQDDLLYVNGIMKSGGFDSIDNTVVSKFIVHSCLFTYTGRISFSHGDRIDTAIKERRLNCLDEIEWPENPDMEVQIPEVLGQAQGSEVQIPKVLGQAQGSEISEPTPSELTSSDRDLLYQIRDAEIAVVSEVMDSNLDVNLTRMPNVNEVASAMLKISIESLGKKSLFEQRLEQRFRVNISLFPNQSVIPPKALYIPTVSSGQPQVNAYGFEEVMKMLNPSSREGDFLSLKYRQMLEQRFRVELAAYRRYLALSK